MKKCCILIGLLFCGAALAKAAEAEYASEGKLVVYVAGALTESHSREIVGQIKFLPPEVAAVVIVIDSTGGALPDIWELADALESSKVPTYAYVKNAVATSVFIVAACDTIVSDERGIIGGPGVVPRDYFALGDDLFSQAVSELTKKIATYADQSGHDVDVFTAMVDSKQVLIRNEKTWKESNEILALTAREMVAISIASSKWPSVDAFVASLKIKPNQTGDDNSE